MGYTNKNYILRDGANLAFHEAVGNIFQLPIATPKHFECHLGLDLGYGVDCNGDGETNPPKPEDINYLYFLALDKVSKVFPSAIYSSAELRVQ